MSIETGLVFGVLLLMLVGLISEVMRPELLIMSALFLFVLTGVITPEEALVGFSNQGMLTIGLLFIIGGVFEKSGLVEKLVTHFLSGTTSEKGARTRLLVPLVGISGFLNNTPLVVTLTPVVRRWCLLHQREPSKFLLPLSYASILGGTLTLMGTSTNLVIHGMMLDFGEEGLRFFDIAVAGIPITVAGIVYLLFFMPRLLPGHHRHGTFTRKRRDYLSEIRVRHNFPYKGRSLRESGLERVEGLYLLEIRRGPARITPASGDAIIHEGDRLIFTGEISSIANLGKRKGLVLETGTDLRLEDLKRGKGTLQEGIVSHQSSLLGRTIKECRFRENYDAAIVAIHRNEEKVEGKIGEIEPKAGDVLLMVAGETFERRLEGHQDFYKTSFEEVGKFYEDDRTGWIALTIFAGGLLLAVSGFLTVFNAMVLAVGVMFLFRIVSPEEARDMIQFRVLLMIAGALGIGNVLQKTGAAEWLAGELAKVSESSGVLLLLVVLYCITALLTEIVTNNAAAVIMFPVAYQLSDTMGGDPAGVAILIAVAASASFLSPIGYQTNLIVFEPGGYRFRDYIRAGLPLTIITGAITVTIVHYSFFS